MNKKRLFLFSFWCLSLIALLISCSAAPEAVTEVIEVEVTRVVTETVEVEGEVVEVTVVEVVVEEVVVEVEEVEEEAAEEAMEEEDFIEFDESGQDDVEAIGSEGAIGDIPPTPEGGPKVEETRTADGNEGEVSNPDVRAQTDDAIASTDSSVGSSITEANLLSAGELDDNTNFDEYLAYLNNYTDENILLADVSERIRLSIVDTQDQPVVGATISISAIGEAVTQLITHSDGAVLFFPNTFENMANSYTLTLTHNDTAQTETITLDGIQNEWTFTLADAIVDNTAVALDLVFVIDTTASMRDELNELKENIRFIATQVNTLPANLDIQYGMITYRDINDAYLTALTPFTSDINRFADALELVTAAGGGDYPEDLHTALSESLNDLAWRDSSRIGLIFVIADAPPHLDYDQENDYLKSIEIANELGLKIFPIASSGLDDQGEYIFRQLAQMTNGRFVFITDDVSGGSNATDSSAPVTTESAYTVGQLDQLIINIIADEISNLRPD